MSGPRATRSAASTSFTDLAVVLARGYLHLAKTSRPVAVLRADAEQIPLEGSRPESPDHVVGRATRRAS